MSLRKHERLGDIARRVLRDTNYDVVKPVLEEAKARETPHVLQITTQARGDLLARYLRGEHIAVWNELRSFESIGGDLFLEAQVVAKETMNRVARNADLLAKRLEDLCWLCPHSEMRSTPKEGDQEIMRRIEGYAVCPIPLSLRIFWEIVGGIDFTWNDEFAPVPNIGVGLQMDRMDPLCVYPPERLLDYHFEIWEEQITGVDPELREKIGVPISPDDLHKCNVSGGDPYMVMLPFLGVDPIVAWEGHDYPFVDYLRYAMKWGGFPMLDQHADQINVQEFVKRMTNELEPF